jgi:hypothetical protein
MSELEYREVSERARRESKNTLQKCQASRDYWKFTAIVLFFLSVFCLLELSGCLADLN